MKSNISICNVDNDPYSVNDPYSINSYNQPICTPKGLEVLAGYWVIYCREGQQKTYSTDGNTNFRRSKINIHATSIFLKGDATEVNI